MIHGAFGFGHPPRIASAATVNRRVGCWFESNLRSQPVKHVQSIVYGASQVAVSNFHRLSC